MSQKECVSCHELKPLSAFGKNKAKKDQLHIYCKACVNTKTKLSSKPVLTPGIRVCSRCKLLLPNDRFNKDSSKTSGYASYCKTCHNQWKSEHRQKPEFSYDMKFNSIRQGAKYRKLDFTLEKDVYLRIVLDPCTYCGSDSKGGLDRVNSNLGYSEENVVSCCETCNRMKLDHPLTTFLDHIEKIYHYYFEI